MSDGRSNCGDRLHFKDIHLFRFDDITGDVYILAGDHLQIIVPPRNRGGF